jgi:C4-dicarboxylate-specific signal transduction histidine kinase
METADKVQECVDKAYCKQRAAAATDATAQAAIALEITRRERQLRELQMELAHANRLETMGQLTASITQNGKPRGVAAGPRETRDESAPNRITT